jgi:2-polyprenyl-6-methoxyphenol hydroxylase-like FAD-dependent oxidoreductase
MAQTITTRCCIAGGGPAGMMLGLLLARAGIDVVVLEKHADFLRDFRGDTIHPSTLELMHELGLLDRLLALPHQKVERLGVQFGGAVLPIADLTHLPTRCKFIAIMPQWDFLHFLSVEAAKYAGFQLIMRAEATDLIRDNDGRVAGVQATTPDGPLEVRAPLTIAADGRHSTLRAKAGLRSQEFGAPMDVLWFRLSRRPDDPAATGGIVEPGRLFVLINRAEHWQCAFVIPKGAFDAVRARGLDAFRADIARLTPFAAQRVHEIASWDDVKLLTVQVDRLQTWHAPGLLCIGDAAHAMSPVGGVGINLAIQDAVAAANLLHAPLRAGRITEDDLHRVQRRRDFPTRATQRFQLIIQNNIIRGVLQARGAFRPPLLLRLFSLIPALQRIPARVLGLGLRPEHIRSPIA